ncbi:MAG: universal stress protein [Kiloniellales bacterium]|nr:universal stress protein [Kiloniellales bacterium]
MINANGATGACTEAAFGLAERLGAGLEVLHPCPPPTQRLPYATELSPVYFEDLVDVARKRVDEGERQATDWFEEQVSAHPGVATELMTVEGLVSAAVAMRAKVSDLAVLPSIAEAEAEFWTAARDAALFHSGRPVLVVPNEAKPFGETVVIAWKDAVEAVRAIAAAAPLLATARHVRLLSIDEGEESDDTGSGMADYLTRAGYPVKLETVSLGDRQVGEALLEVAGSGVLLVMGAYGHWRWREWVFGGATFHVLCKTDVAVLMCH